MLACLKEDDVLALETGLVLKPMSCDSVGFSYLMAHGSCLDGGVAKCVCTVAATRVLLVVFRSRRWNCREFFVGCIAFGAISKGQLSCLINLMLKAVEFG